MGKALDLMNQVFDYLKVVDKAPPSRSGKSMWLCECRCGNRVIVRGTSLTSGQTTSCGCKKKNDLKGRNIGMLTVLERSDRYAPRGARKNRLWKCRCDCGAITYKATDALTNDGVSMCSECAGKYGVAKAREKAGFVAGTQISKIKNITGESKGITGVRGVTLVKKTGKYCARIKFQGKTYYLGTYIHLADAVKARRAGEEKYYGTFLAEHDNSKTNTSEE